MKFVKKLGIFLLVVISLLLFAIAFAFEARSYHCSGELSTERGMQTKTATMEILYYRDGIRIFSTSDGYLTLHIQSMDEEHFSHIKHIGYFLDVYDNNATHMIGRYLKIEKVLHLNTSAGLFQGECVDIK